MTREARHNHILVLINRVLLLLEITLSFRSVKIQLGQIRIYFGESFMTAQLLTPKVDLQKDFKFTVEQYHLMHEAGVFSEGDRLELIAGEIKTMSPIGRKHAACIIRLAKLLEKKLGDRALISVQNPIDLGNKSQPQPDLAVLKPRDDFYEEALPTPADILLIIEVADSSLEYDRDIKVSLYATAGISEMWLFDVNNKMIAGFSQPSALGYKRIDRYDRGDRLTMQMFPDMFFEWEELFYLETTNSIGA